MFGLGTTVAAWLRGRSTNVGRSLVVGLCNPTLLGTILGIFLQRYRWPEPVEASLQGFAWGTLVLAVVLVGMRLSYWRPRRSLSKVWPGLLIKLGIMPLMVGLVLRGMGVTSPLLLTMVLQAAMPPAFATLVVAEAYDLDREVAVTAIAVGTGMVLLLLPMWLWVFG